MIEYLLSLSLLIAVVLLIRAVFRKTVSPRVTYALWLLVVIRMMVPVTLFEADVTLYNYLQNWQTEQTEQTEEMLEDSEEISEENVQSPGTELQQTTPTYPSQNTTLVTPAYPPSTPFIPITPTVPENITPVVPIVPETEAEPPILSEDVIPEVPEEPAVIHWQRIANLVWFIGAAVVAVWVFCTAVTYNRRLVRNRILHRTVRGTKVYISEDASVPCISGLIPSIYITPEAANSKSEMLIIIHEHVHLRHGDHIWAFIRALALIVFWYNPLVWAAATVSKLDAELACDDAISAKLNDAARLKYAHILLDTIPQKHRYATGLGSAPMKERILMLTKRQKNRGICLILALVLAVSAVGCSFIGKPRLTLENIFEQKGFTILSQERKEIELSFPSSELPSYEEISYAENAEITISDRNITAYRNGTSAITIERIGIHGQRPAGMKEDILYIGFVIQNELTDADTLLSISRIVNENEELSYQWLFSIADGILTDGTGIRNDAVDTIGWTPENKFFAAVDANTYAQLTGEVRFSVTLNEITYARGNEVKIYGPESAEDDMSELDPADQQTETFISMDAYVTDRMAKETTAQYYTYGPDGKSISSQSKTANVIDTKLLRLEKKGELAGLAAEGILECWEYEYLIKLDVPAEEIIPVGGQYGDDGWFDLTGQGNHITVALRYPDNTYTVLRDTCVGDGIDFMGYHNTYEEAIYDWYVKEYALDLPLYVQDWADKITVPDGGHLGNQPVHRFDGDGWSIYIPLSAWYLSTDAGENEWIWHSSYLTGSTLLVEALSDAMESETPENIQTDGTYSHTYDYDNPNGGFWRVTISWTEEGITDYPYIAIEPQLLRLMAESFIVSAEKNDKSDSFDPDDFSEPEKNDGNYTLADFKNSNPGNNLVYEGYTVEYECESPYGGKFDFHIHLPQLNSDAPNAQKWNTLYQEYENEFGEQLLRTVHGTNTENYAHITYDTVTTGDVLTIYIVKSHGIIGSGAAALEYDIFHYNTKEDRFLSTDEFLAYYAEGQFADYTVADIVKFMNEHTFTTDEGGSPYPLTEENILGVIPSVFGDGKFDVVYQGFSIEGRFATRMLFSPYPTYTSDAVYTYRLTYHDYVDCEDKEIYGDPMGYRLLISQRVVGEYDAGYYVDCLFTEDIAERPESYSQAVYGEYYTPIQQDAYGNMHMVIDHETDWGHLSAWIPFDMPDTAQDYYWGIHNKYFSYDRILNGTNYQVNQHIAGMVGQVLDAYRNGKDPNELFPASKTEYTPYPLGTIRENPTHEEIGEILKTTSVGESGIINFYIDLGDGWRMALPMDIAGFGDGAQAYFTGVYFAHGTSKEEEDIEWTQYSETRTGEDGNIYQISFVLPVEWMHGSGGILNDANGKKRIGSRYIAVNRSKEDFVSSLEEMAEQYHVDLDSPLTGTSDSGISYMGYCFEGECEIPGDITGRYLYRFAYSDSISLQMDVWKRNAYDDDSFYEQYVLPIIQSVTIGVTGDHVDTITSLEDYKLLGPDFYESYYEYTRALIDGDTVKMEELSMYPEGTLDSYRDVRFTFKSVTREAETGRFILTAEVSEGHVVIPGGTQQFYYCEYPRRALVPILEPPAPNATEASAELSKLLNMTMKFNLDEMEVTEYVIDCLYRKTGKTNFTENEIVEYAKKCFGVDSLTPNEHFKRDGVYTSLAHGGNHIYHDVISTNYGDESGIYSVTVRFYADYAKTVYSHLIKYTMVKLDGDFSFLAQYIEEESPLKPFTHAT